MIAISLDVSESSAFGSHTVKTKDGYCVDDKVISSFVLNMGIKSLKTFPFVDVINPICSLKKLVC